MKPLRDVPQCTDEAARLLPWFVNGTLSDGEARLVAHHLEQCACCRADAAALDRVRELMRAPAQVEHAPHAGLRRLLARIDAEPFAGAAPQASTTTAAGARHSRALRWLAAAVIVQAVALAGIGVALLLRAPAADAPAQFRTLTATAREAASLRVAFDPATTLAELQELLRANRLVAIAGPSEAGIFTLALTPPANGPDEQRAALARLRADPRVRFAEPLGPEAGR